MYICISLGLGRDKESKLEVRVWLSKFRLFLSFWGRMSWVGWWVFMLVK